MFAWILYIAIAVSAGLLITMVLNMFRKDTSKDSENPYGLLRICLALALVGPFLASEVLTNWLGGPMEKAIKGAYADKGLGGSMQYFKVNSYTGSHATAIIVGEEPDDWGGKDRPILEASLSRQPNGPWKVDSCSILHSSKLGQDSLVFPPYR